MSSEVRRPGLAREIVHRRGKPDRPGETTSGRKPVQWDHRTCCGTRGPSGQNTEGCAGIALGPESRPTQGYFAGWWNWLHGRKDNTPIQEFGEKTLYMPAKAARGGKWEPRFHPGVFVGMLNSSA